MMHFNTAVDPHRYVNYYQKQAGGSLPGYAGVPSMYGAGLGGLFRGLFRMAMPLLRKGIVIAKPHLKAAARNIAGDVITNVMNHRMNNQKDKTQNGSGLLVMSRTNVKRPPGVRSVLSTFKNKGKTKKRSVSKRKSSNKQRRGGVAKKGVKNIF